MKNYYTFILTLLLGVQAFAQVSVGNGTYTSFSIGPINTLYEYSYYQIIYKASDINATGTITSIEYEMLNANPINNSDEQIDIWVGHTSKNAFVDGYDWISTSEMTKVLTNGTAVKSGTTVTLTFDTPFVYNGVDNLVIAIDANEPTYDQGGMNQFYYSEAHNEEKINIHYRGDNFNPDPNNTTAIANNMFTSYHYPNIKINGISQSCPRPTNITMDNIMGTSVDISWNQEGSATNWTIEYGPKGFSQGNGTIINVTSNPYTLTGLTSTTDYEFYINTNCNTNDSSSKAGPYSFTTACTTIAENFEVDFSAYPPNCWNIANGPMGGTLQFGASKWRNNRAFMSAEHDVIQSNAVNLYTNTQRTWLISNNYDLSNANFTLETLVALTDYSFSGLSTHGDTATMGSDDKVMLLISTDNGTTWTDLATWNINNQPAVSGNNMTFDLSDYNGVVKFAFYATDGEIDNNQDYDFHIGKFKMKANNLAVNDVKNHKSNYDFYPNPVNDILIIKGERNVGKVSVYDVAGKLVYQNEFSRDTANVDLKKLTTGHYVVNAEIDGIMQNFKIIKK